MGHHLSECAFTDGSWLTSTGADGARVVMRRGSVVTLGVGMNMVIKDIREYVFPLYVGTDPATLEPGAPIKAVDSKFLGNGFFVAKNGVALAAAHCLPRPADLPAGETVLAALWDGTIVRAHQVVASTIIPNYDVAILKVRAAPVRHLPVAFTELTMGSDVSTVGIAQHSVWGGGKEFRCLKGHVTFAARFLELSFAAPRGMSGSPVFDGTRVAAVLTGNARSETLDDIVEETTQVADGRTTITKIETKAVINYGLAEPLAKLRDWSHEITGGRPFAAFIDWLNSRPPTDA